MARPIASLLALLLTIAALWCLAPSSPPRPHVTTERPELAVLRRFGGMDLKNVEPEKLRPLRAALRSLDPVRTAEFLAERRRLRLEHESLDEFEAYRDPRPRFVWAYRPDGKLAGWVLFEQQFEVESPNPTRFRLTFFDSTGAVRARGAFDSGPRRQLEVLGLMHFPEVVGPVVLVAVASPVHITHPNRVRRRYGRVGDRFELVREQTEPGASSKAP